MMDQLKTVLDPELGSRVRAVITTIVGALVAIGAVLQSVLEVTDSLPNWKVVGAIAMLCRSGMSVLSHFTKVGNAQSMNDPQPLP